MIIATGEMLSPMRVRFQSVRPELWHWKVAISTPWREHSHVNVLEVLAGLLDLIRRTRKKSELGHRYLVLLDSYVALGVLSKRRSSSYKLQRVLRRFAAIELAAGTCPFFCYVRSAFNPADRPSRRPPAHRSAWSGIPPKKCRRK